MLLFSGYLLTSSETSALKSLLAKCKRLRSLADIPGLLDPTDPLLALPDRAGLQGFQGLDGSEASAERFLRLFYPLVRVQRDGGRYSLELDSAVASDSSLAYDPPPQATVAVEAQARPQAPDSGCSSDLDASTSSPLKAIIDHLYPQRNPKTHPQEAIRHAAALAISSSPNGLMKGGSLGQCQAIRAIRAAANSSAKLSSVLESCPVGLIWRECAEGSNNYYYGLDIEGAMALLLSSLYPERSPETHPYASVYYNSAMAVCEEDRLGQQDIRLSVVAGKVANYRHRAGLEGIKFSELLMECPEGIFDVFRVNNEHFVKLDLDMIVQLSSSGQPAKGDAGITSESKVVADMITVVDSLDRLATMLTLAKQSSAIAIDLEGDLNASDEVYLVQLALDSGYIFIADLLATPQPDFQERLRLGLQHLLDVPSTVKVFHGGRGDFDALVRLLKVDKQRLAKGFVDTQALYGSVLRLRATVGGMAPLTGLQEPLGLNALLARYGLPLNPQKEHFKARFRREGTDVFKRRPLSSEEIEYAAEDVRHLLELRRRVEADLRTVPAIMTAVVRGQSLGYGGVLVDNVTAPKDAASAEDNAYARALQLPVGVALSLTFDPRTHKPKYNVLVPTDGNQPDVNGPDKSEAVRRREEESMAAFQEALNSLSQALPPRFGHALAQALEQHPNSEVVEITVDVARVAEVRFSDGWYERIGVFSVTECMNALLAAKRAVEDSSHANQDIWRPRARTARASEAAEDDEAPLDDASDPFFTDNRLGLPGMLHRISAFRDKQGGVYGLTYRLGVPRQGTCELIADIVELLARRSHSTSLLVVGRPGSGKTTLLRDLVRRLANVHHKNVVVVDTSNEIGGDSVLPHPVLGRARRMMVRSRSNQHEVLLEAVANHMPDIVVCDELGTRKEAESVKSIAERGVSMLATAHGIDLGSLIRNPELDRLVGGKTTVTIGDKLAMSAGVKADARKTKTERAGVPVFDMLLELRSKTEWIVYKNVSQAVDEYLARKVPASEKRWIDEATGEMRAQFQASRAWTSSEELEMNLDGN